MIKLEDDVLYDIDWKKVIDEYAKINGGFPEEWEALLELSKKEMFVGRLDGSLPKPTPEYKDKKIREITATMNKRVQKHNREALQYIGTDEIIILDGENPDPAAVTSLVEFVFEHCIGHLRDEL